jgi:hypothetical protein
MGALEPGEGAYYRIHGPAILIEFDHAANIRVRGLPPDPNHIHTIVRRPGGDLGADLLAQHYRDSTHHAPVLLAQSRSERQKNALR